MDGQEILGVGTPENENANGTVQNTTISGSETPVPAENQQNAAYDYGKMIDANGGLAENWKEGLPESIRGEKCLDAIKTVQTLAQGYVHAQKSIGAKKVAIPGDGASAEDWAAFYTACGRPAAEGDYKTDSVKLPEGVTLDSGALEGFRKFAFENGMNQKTFEAALAYDVSRVKSQMDAAQKAKTDEYNETLSKLHQEYGGNFEHVIQQCNKALDTFGLTEVMREKGLLNNYTIIKALAGIGERISESKLKGAEAQMGGNDPAARLKEITENPDDPYYKREHPAHFTRVQEVAGLMKAMANVKK